MTEILSETAASGGDITSNGGAPVVSRGVCWNTSASPTVANNKTVDSVGSGPFISLITGLTPNTIYLVRAYATNSAGTSYGNQVLFTTGKSVVPDLTQKTTGKAEVPDLTQKTTGKGEVPVLTQKTTGKAEVPVLTQKTINQAEVPVLTQKAISQGEVPVLTTVTITSVNGVAAILTDPVSSITTSGSVSGGKISDGGGSTITGRGVCWSTLRNPTILDSKSADGSGTGSFTSKMRGLHANTMYYVRAYSTDSLGTHYGDELSFKTFKAGQIVDVDGGVYNTITLGAQTFFAENLKTTKYNDGTSIPLEPSRSAWGQLITPAYCWYNTTTYGALYNWSAVNTGKLCPTGWHVPSDAEWEELVTYLGGLSLAGGKMKEIGTTYWNSPNTEATNESGFTALPGGYRSNNGAFGSMGYGGYWWSSTEFSATDAWSIDLRYGDSHSYRSYTGKQVGLSVRCFMDN
ncbi:MAG: fibrobacter succinogenes major paralogous domain-containing protein [Bacteroidota bacterium]